MSDSTTGMPPFTDRLCHALRAALRDSLGLTDCRRTWERNTPRRTPLLLVKPPQDGSTSPPTLHGVQEIAVSFPSIVPPRKCHAHGVSLMLCLVIIGLFAISTLNAVAFGDVPPDLASAVKFQQKNKGEIIKKLQQRAVAYRQQGNAEAAKETKAIVDAVRANKLLVLPPLGEASSDLGTIQIERVLEKSEDGVRIATSLPRFENTGVNVRTGGRGVSPASMGLVYYPEKLDVVTKNTLQAGQTINVRRSEAGLIEITQQEMDAASALLKGD